MLRSSSPSLSCNDIVSVEYDSASTGAHLARRGGAESILYLVRASIVGFKDVVCLVNKCVDPLVLPAHVLEVVEAARRVENCNYMSA